MGFGRGGKEGAPALLLGSVFPVLLGGRGHGMLSEGFFVGVKPQEGEAVSAHGGVQKLSTPISGEM